VSKKKDKLPLEEKLADIELKLLAGVLELTVIVAQTGAKVVPPIEAPIALRPFLRFSSKVPGPALRAARRVLDDDAFFRARVATVATADLVGSAGELYVKRPLGWESDFEALVVEEMGEVSKRSANQRVAELEKRSADLETALATALVELVHVRSELALATENLVAESRHRAVLSDEVDALRSRDRRATGNDEKVQISLRSLEDELAAALKQRDTAVERAETAERELTKKQSLEATVAAAVLAMNELKTQLQSIGSVPRVPEAVGTNAVSVPQRTTQHVTSALGTLRDHVPSRLQPTRHDVSELNLPTKPGVPRSKSDKTEKTDAMRKPHRKPVALPPAVFDDSVEAAAFLLRVSNVVVLVDGYNVAKWRWPDAKPGDLRDRLTAMAAQLSHRTGAAIHLVFDGKYEGGHASAGGSANVRVIFTQEGIEADDVILNMAAAAPLRTPVVVVSNDMRVVDGSMAVGANVIASQVFVALASNT
jgi:predicted RNA-binding protein with PIN domain/predicted  nucleic acid-binding Zn-ribbon protein